MLESRNIERGTAILSTLSENLRSLIEEANLSERELARRSGVVQPVIHRILAGANKNPTLDTLKALAQYFMISVSELTGEVALKTGKPYVKTNFLHDGWEHVPVLMHSEIDGWLQTGTTGQRIPEHVPVDIEIHEGLFGFKLTDDNMAPLFTKGDVVIVDPKKELRSGQYVLSKVEQNFQIGQLVQNEEAYQLRVPKRKPVTIARSTIIGPIVHAKKYFGE